MYDMPLNGDAVLVENGAVTRVNRIVRSIERTPALADSYNKNGLTKDLIIAAIGQVETNRVARYGARTAGGRFADRYSPGVNEGGKRAAFRRGSCVPWPAVVPCFRAAKDAQRCAPDLRAAERRAM